MIDVEIYFFLYFKICLFIDIEAEQSSPGQLETKNKLAQKISWTVLENTLTASK